MHVVVLLNGCGHLDGSEIHEAVFAMTALEQQGASIQCVAINDWQQSTVNHIEGRDIAEKRNMLVESARIARGDVLSLDQLAVDAYEALVIPGGFGTAKNLCNFATQGVNMTVREEVAQLILKFHKKRKPIGAICIAPVLVGKVLAGQGVRLTSGADAAVAEVLQAWGCVHVPSGKGKCVVDQEHLVVSTPAYMYGESKLNEVYDGIVNLAVELKKLVQRSSL